VSGKRAEKRACLKRTKLSGMRWEEEEGGQRDQEVNGRGVAKRRTFTSTALDGWSRLDL